MSLELVIIGKGGRPEREICISVELHASLIALAERLRLPLIQRMEDYYTDAAFSHDEAGALSAELSIAAAGVGDDSALVALLKEMAQLALVARDQKRNLGALAD